MWCVSGEFEELYTTVNFARRLINLSLGGACIETSGRLRPDVKLSVEVRFDELGGILRSDSRIVWVDSRTEGGLEIHRAGLRFVGTLEATQPVRLYLSGQDPSRFVARRREEYQDLKRKAEARKDGAGSRGGGVRKLITAVLLLSLVYLASYWGFVLIGRVSSPQPGLHYRYFQDRGAEEAAVKVYAPALWLFRTLGVDLVHEAPGSGRG